MINCWIDQNDLPQPIQEFILKQVSRMSQVKQVSHIETGESQIK